MIRCGNFPETGKEIEYEEDYFVKIFQQMQTFVEKAELEKFAITKCFVNKKEFNSAIDFLIEQGFIISENEYNKLISSNTYNRQEMYFHMLSGELKSVSHYKNKQILILGLGGIGSIVAELLVRAGFENFNIIDYDKVEKSNLIRQTAYYYNDVGKLKTDALLEKMLLINSKCNINSENIKVLNEKDIEQHINAADFIVCTLDKPIRKIRRIINDTCVKYKKPVIFSGFAEHVGMVGPFVVPKKSACLSCINNENSEEYLNNVSNAPSFGPLCSIIASLVSSEVINYFVHFNPNNLIGCTLMINMFDYSTNIIHWNRNKDCEKCGDKNDC